MMKVKDKILSILESSEGYVSGEEISRALDISRAAVWKHIKSLRSAGYVISSSTNRGYRLEYSPDTLSAEGIAKGLKTEFIGRNIFLYDETDTTNNRAKENSSSPDGSVFIAETQYGGKGSRGRAWSSPRGNGIYLTVLLKPDLPPSQAAQATLAAGLAVCRAIGHGAQIKWPNDIVIGSKKVCGILTEMSSEADTVNYIACGIGVNVNDESFGGELENKATSMYIESGVKYRRSDVAAQILNELERVYKQFSDGGLAPILDEYRSNCVTLGREVSVIFKNKTVVGTATDVDEYGVLSVCTDDGVIRVNSGDVSVRGIYGYA